MKPGTIKKDVLNWLRAGQPYDEGVQLYTEYGHNATVLKNLSRKETSTRRDKLAYKLVVKIAGLPEKYIKMDPKKLPGSKSKAKGKGKQLKSGTSKNANKSLPVDPKPSYENAWKGKIPYKELPKEVRAWINERVDIEQEITALSEKRLKVPAPNTTENTEARKELSEKIDTLLGQKNELNVKIKYYEDNLKLPEDKKSNETDPVKEGIELTRKYNNLKSQRSKCRNKLSGEKEIAEGPKKAAAREKLAEIETEIKELEKKLGK